MGEIGKAGSAARATSEARLPQYAELAPSGMLAQWIECFWSIRASDAARAPNRVLPDGCVDLIFGLADEPQPLVVGPMRTAALVPLKECRELFGVRFRPGGALPFLGVPLGELTDRRIPLDLLWRNGSSALADAYGSSASLERQAGIEQLLYERMRTWALESRDHDLLATRAVALMRRARGGVRVREVADALGIGERRLERLFDRLVGLNPKTLACVLRFHEVVRRIARETPGRESAWAALAADAGYADQGHLIREFKALAGVTPARYAAERRLVGFVQYGAGASR